MRPARGACARVSALSSVPGSWPESRPRRRRRNGARTPTGRVPAGETRRLPTATHAICVPASAGLTCAPTCGCRGPKPRSAQHLRDAPRRPTDDRYLKSRSRARPPRRWALTTTARRELRAVQQRRRRRRAVPVRRRGRRRRAASLEQGDGVRVAGLPARRRGPASATAFASTGRGIRRRARAATRPSCCSTRTRARSPARCGGTRRCSATRPTTRTGRRQRLGAVRAALGGGRRRVSTGATIAARAARWPTRSSTRSTSRASRSSTPTCPRSCAAPTPGLAHPAAVEHLKRLGVTAVELLPVHQFVHDAQLVAARASQLLGLPVDRVLRAAQRVLLGRRRRRPGRRVPPDGPRAARRRPRGDPRRRLQPHRRGQRVGADAVLPRDRQRRLLPARRTTARATSTTPAAATRSTCISRSRCGW